MSQTDRFHSTPARVPTTRRPAREGHSRRDSHPRQRTRERGGVGHALRRGQGHHATRHPRTGGPRTPGAQARRGHPCRGHLDPRPPRAIRTDQPRTSTWQPPPRPVRTRPSANDSGAYLRTRSAAPSDRRDADPARPGRLAHHLVRLRYARREPLAIMDSYLPATSSISTPSIRSPPACPRPCATTASRPCWPGNESAPGPAAKRKTGFSAIRRTARF